MATWGKKDSTLFSCLLGLLLCALLFFHPTEIFHNPANANWVGLGLFTFLLSVWVLYRNEPFVLPLQKFLVPFLVGSALLVLPSLVHGAYFTEERWLQRYIVVFLFFLLIQLFRGEEERWLSIRWPVLFLILFLCTNSFYQYWFKCPVVGNYTTSCYSSQILNSNLLAQILLFSIPLINFFWEKESNPRRRGFYSFILGLTVYTILLTYCRSTWLGLFGYLVLLVFNFFKNKKNNRVQLQIFTILVSTTLFGLGFFIGGNRVFSQKNVRSSQWEYVQESKKSSLIDRTSLFRSVLDVSQDHFFGLGVNRFIFSGTPYRTKYQDSTSLNPANLYKSPHSEVLRILAEEGWIPFFYVCFVLVYLCHLSFKSIHSEDIHQKGLPLVFVPVLSEYLFQFPTEQPIVCLLFLLGIIFCMPLYAQRVSKSKPLHRMILTGISLWCLITFMMVGLRSTLIGRSQSAWYCSVFHDNFESCIYYYYNHLEHGETKEASDSLKPVLKYDVFNYVAHKEYASLGNMDFNILIQCPYHLLFHKKFSISDYPPAHCEGESTYGPLKEQFKNAVRKIP